MLAPQYISLMGSRGKTQSIPQIGTCVGVIYLVINQNRALGVMW